MATKKVVEKPQSPRDRLNVVGIDAVCAHVASGESLRSWAIQNGFALMTVNDWIADDEDRAVKYARAREERADVVFESLDDVSEQAATAASAVEVAGLRLKADNIKWKLARMHRKYNDKVDVEHSGAVTVSSAPMEELASSLKDLMAKMQ